MSGKSLRVVFYGEVEECGECGLFGMGGAAAQHVYERADGGGEMTAVALRSLGEAPDILGSLHTQTRIIGLQKHQRRPRSFITITVDVAVAAAIFHHHF